MTDYYTRLRTTSVPSHLTRALDSPSHFGAALLSLPVSSLSLHFPSPVPSWKHSRRSHLSFSPSPSITDHPSSQTSIISSSFDTSDHSTSPPRPVAKLFREIPFRSACCGSSCLRSANIRAVGARLCEHGEPAPTADAAERPSSSSWSSSPASADEWPCAHANTKHAATSRPAQRGRMDIFRCVRICS